MREGWAEACNSAKAVIPGLASESPEPIDADDVSFDDVSAGSRMSVSMGSGLGFAAPE